MEIKYDTPIEVSENKYDFLMKEYAGVVAGRRDPLTAKYFIKVWVMAYKNKIKQIIES